jgi:hypothetical protein
MIPICLKPYLTILFNNFSLEPDCKPIPANLISSFSCPDRLMKKLETHLPVK